VPHEWNSTVLERKIQGEQEHQIQIVALSYMTEVVHKFVKDARQVKNNLISNHHRYKEEANT
jgi:hypothetical protein